MIDIEDIKPITWQCGHYYLSRIDQVPTLNIEHPKAKCVISLFGGQVLSYTPAGGDDLLWLSKHAVFDGKTAIRGGIPICWPWFGNRHDGLNSKKSHGFARNSQWSLNSLSSNNEFAQVELSLSSNLETKSVFPFEFELTLIINIAETLDVQLYIKNLDESAFDFTTALHSYFKVSQLDQTAIFGLGPNCLDSVDKGNPITVAEPFYIKHALDYIFRNQSTITLEQPESGTLIESDNAASWVVWSPWQEGASNFEDMSVDEYQDMLCVEPAILTHPIVLKSGQTHRLDLSISHNRG